MTKRPNYIVYAPSFSETSGGSIFIHSLVHTLNVLGESAFIWPWGAPPSRNLSRTILKFLGKPELPLKLDHTLPKLGTAPGFDTPQARYSDLQENSIIVYPEVTLGNPLGGGNVVRWLLYTPGIKDPFEFTPNEIFFRAGEMSDLPDITGGAQDLYLWYIHPAYKNENRPNRSGACYTLRKGHEKPRIPQTTNAICIDEMSHAETADIFNKCAEFYAYDEATFYSQYAALCGCLSIVVPGKYKSRQEWVKAHPLGRYGVAYGVDDTAHANATRGQVHAMLNQKVEDGVETVRAFIETTQNAFTGTNTPSA